MYLKTWLLLYIFLLAGSVSIAQNLVINGGFERQAPRQAGVWQAPPKPCAFSGSAEIVNTSAQGWRTFEIQTPDLLVNDTSKTCPDFPAPHSGQRMMGLIMYHPFQDGQFAFDYHELIQGTLAKPLEKGKTYRLSFWVYSNDSLGSMHLNKVYGRTTGVRPTLCGNFGFYFSDAPINIKENFMLSQVDFAVKPQVNLEKIVETNGRWRKISLAYTPDRSTYKYFLFGNFFFDAVTRINMDDEARMQLDQVNQSLPFWKKNKRIAYYLFDDFSIVADDNAVIEQSLLVENQYVMQDALLFDLGKSELRPEAGNALDRLATVLIKNTTLQFEIAGHTDDTGSETDNQNLSEARAKTVYEALLSRGVKATQLTWSGHGESRPVASNETEEGRQKNRRVECQVLD
ncbi:MAG: OmpA family protein [Saprospiraceae bacterium]|nr:OmpA family protein [Saprospiraceae bacterium]